MRVLVLALFGVSLSLAQAAAQEAAPRAPAPEPAPRPQPIAVYGYPPMDVDQRAMVALLEDGRFDELESTLRDLDRATRADVTNEMRLEAAYLSFYGSDESIGPRLDEWVEAHPESVAPLLARAQFLNARTWAARGESTRIIDVQAMRRFRDEGVQDVVRALDIDPDNLAVYMAGFRMESTAGWSADAAALLDAALARYPTSYVVRRMASGLMQPRWGGSYALMEEMAADAQRYADRNPRLRTLLGLASAERAHMHTINREYDAALEVLEEARPLGVDWTFYYERGRALYHANRPLEAIPALDSALAIRPHSDALVEYRGRAYYWAARGHVPPEQRVAYLERATADFVDAVRMKHGDTALSERLADAATARGRCSEAPVDCFSTPAGDRIPRVAGPWWWQVFVFVVSLPYTLYRIFADGQRLYLLPAPLLGAALVLWSLREWVRQRFWTPRLIHVMAALGLATIIMINVAWVQAGGEMWLQRYVVIAIFGLFPYVAYLLFLGPRTLGRRHVEERQRALGANDLFA